jgi:hypothetical protein
MRSRIPMRWAPAALLACSLASCGGDDGPIDTMEKCKDAGGRFVPAPGPPARCQDDEEKIGDIPFGIEGAICCRRKPAR